MDNDGPYRQPLAILDVSQRHSFTGSYVVQCNPLFSTYDGRSLFHNSPYDDLILHSGPAFDHDTRRRLVRMNLVNYSTDYPDIIVRRINRRDRISLENTDQTAQYRPE